MIPSTTYDPYCDGPLHRTKTPLVGPGQNKLKVHGCFEATLEKGKDEVKETVYVVEGLQTPLAGIPTIRKLSLISEVNSVNKSKEDIMAQFPELELIKGSYRIELEEEAKPYSIMAPRRVPIPLLPKVKCELEKMEREGVISKINEPSDWCSGMVVVQKPNNGVRICLDLTKLNCYVKRERHILPSVNHVLAQIGDAKFFSKLDANSGFWQIELSPDSSKLTTFITPFGRYKFNRLPFGISSAPELFQKKMLEILSECDGVVGLTDDLLIYGKTEEEHHRRLVTVLEERTKPIRDLLSNKKQWYWGPNQEKAFLELKESLCTEKCLALFEPNRQMIVSADASAYGLGAVLRQKQPDRSLRLIICIKSYD